MFTEEKDFSLGTAIKNAIFYAGADRSSFEMVKSKIQRTNRVMVTTLSAIASLLITAMIITSFKSESIMQNRIVYELGLAASLIVLLLSLTVAKKVHWLATALVYASYSIYYLYGILIGAITDPEGKTVTFMVMLVFMPTLFIDRPIQVFVVTLVYDLIFIVLSISYKTGNVLSVDIIDAIVFGILGIASGTVINHVKVRGYVSEEVIKKISRTDQLTDMNNQNSFKLDLYKIPGRCKRSLACIYIDANGLHKLNNERGHDEGDKMLQYVAGVLKECFGSELTYRTGGDEFAVFVIDPNRERMIQDMHKFIELVSDAKYSVALGYDIRKIDYRFSIDELVKSADERMREDKKIYRQKFGR